MFTYDSIKNQLKTLNVPPNIGIVYTEDTIIIYYISTAYTYCIANITKETAYIRAYSSKYRNLKRYDFKEYNLPSEENIINIILSSFNTIQKYTTLKLLSTV